VILATRIPKERCRQINLGHMDPDSIKPAEYAGREDEGVLYLPKAGEILYRLKDMSKFCQVGFGFRVGAVSDRDLDEPRVHPLGLQRARGSGPPRQVSLRSTCSRDS